MSNLVIVAIPEEDDRVWKVSSEKVPHLTLLFLGDADNVGNLQDVVQFVEHAVEICEHGPFMLDVDYRDTLGVDEADVLFFKKGRNLRWIEQFRSQLLQENNIRTAYDSTEQFPEWNAHLTLGYPESPAKEDDHAIHWVSFDRIAVWTDDFDGPEFRLTWPEREFEGPDYAVAYSSMNAERVRLGMAALKEDLEHHGIKGMKWGHRKEGTPGSAGSGSANFRKGQVSGLPHWGVRKSQPPPVAVKPKAESVVPHGKRLKTKIDVEGGENHPAHEDAIKVAEARAKLVKSGAAALSNKELREVATRLQLEQQVKQLNAPIGKKFVTNLLKSQGNQSVNRFATKKVQERFA